MALPESNLIEFVLQDSMDNLEPVPEIGFYDNLAEGFLSEEEVERIGSMVMDSYEADKESRSEWESMFEKGFELLGLKLSTTSEPFQGACTAVHPMLIESAVKFQSKASEELFPPQGPVKTQIVGVPDSEKEDQAYRVQTFMNYQLTEVMPEYFDEFERMLFHLPLVGSAFKKIYYDLSSDRPVSEFVPVDQFYVSYNATDLRRADRYTHVIYMTPHELQKQMMSGMYRDVDLSDPGEFQPSSMSQTINSIMGIEFNAEYDKQYTLLEQHLYLELDGDDFPSPYIVTIEKDSGKVLSIRRNWNEGDPTCEKKMFFTHYKYVPGFGFYGLGLIHFLGNLTMSATLSMRSLLDAGQFANLPGGFKARGIRIVGGDDPIAPGEFKEVEATGMDLNKAIVPLPYKEPSQTLYQLLGFITQAGQKFADSTDAVVADSTNYGPVGTTLALIEASAKLFSAIHKRLHKAQKDELRILARLNYEFLPDERLMLPIPGMDLSVFRSDFDGRIDIIPVSDPNIPSQAHRLAQAQMLLQISAQTPPGTYNMREVHRSLLSAAGIPDPNRFLSPEMQPQPQDPVSDVIAASKGMPISAFPGQDHQAYITVFSSFLQDPTLGQNKALQSIGPLLQAAIRDHMMMQYQETMGGFLQGATPDVMPEIMAEASQQILNANQQLGQYQSLEQQQLMLETKGLELREKDMAQSNAKDIAELSLKKQELDIRKRGQDIEAARDIGANTIRSKEADNKKDIMLQKFLLEGLGKMRDITSSQETKGFAEGGMVNFDDVIALINSYETEQLGTGSDVYPDEARAMAEAAAQRNNVPPVSERPSWEVTPSTPTLYTGLPPLPEVKPMVPQSSPEVAEPAPTTFTETLSDVLELPPVSSSVSRDDVTAMAGATLPTFEGAKDHPDPHSGQYTFAGGILADPGTVTVKDDGTYDTSLATHTLPDGTKFSLSDYGNDVTKWREAILDKYYTDVSTHFDNKQENIDAGQTFADQPLEAQAAMLDLAWNTGVGSGKWFDVTSFFDQARNIADGKEYDLDELIKFVGNFRDSWEDENGDEQTLWSRGVLRRRAQQYNLVAPADVQAYGIVTNLTGNGLETKYTILNKAGWESYIKDGTFDTEDILWTENKTGTKTTDMGGLRVSDGETF